MIFKSAAAIRLVELRAEGFVLKHDVEHVAQPLEEALCAALGLDVGNGGGNGDFGFSFENVKSRGTEFAFAADDLVLAKAVLDDGAAIEFEEGSGDAVEYGDLQKILGFQSLRIRTGSDYRACDVFVGLRARVARAHSFAAGNTRGIAHRRIKIEGN